MISLDVFFYDWVYIGTIQGASIQAMGCLLSDGTFLTTLHTIYDYYEGKYFNLSHYKIYFVIGRSVYVYNIAGVIHDGTTALARYGITASTFDYALLRLDSNPIAELGGGLQLDPISHGSSAFSTDPLRTIAMSGPLFQLTNRGIVSSRLFSYSQNRAAISRYYMFSQMGDHAAFPGLSGQAIFPANNQNKFLYAIHCGLSRTNTARFGFKVSEYLKVSNRLNRLPNTQYSHHNQILFRRTLQIINYEGLRRDDRMDINRFLSVLKFKLNNPKINIQLPINLETARYLDTHQPQHIFRSRWPQKAYFYDTVATCADSPCQTALANCVNKIASEHYQRQIKPQERINNQNLKISLTFIIDVGFNIGYDVKAQSDTSLIAIDGFSGVNYHIYPTTLQSIRNRNKAVIINAQDYIGALREIQLASPRNTRVQESIFTFVN